MKSTRWFACGLTFVLATSFIGACGGDETEAPPATPEMETSETLRVTDVSLGSSINPNRSVSASTSDFAPTDTIYASVATEGTGSGATLTARWQFEDGQVVDETSQPISPTGPAYTEFHISMPGGLPAGDYSVEILLNGESAATEAFEVE